MSWTIEPVHNYEDITSAYRRHVKQSKTLRSIVMLNCGGSVDLFEELRLYEKPELITYVIDSHRPFHPNNVGNVNQVRLVLTFSRKSDFLRSVCSVSLRSVASQFSNSIIF